MHVLNFLFFKLELKIILQELNIHTLITLILLFKKKNSNFILISKKENYIHMSYRNFKYPLKKQKKFQI